MDEAIRQQAIEVIMDLKGWLLEHADPSPKSALGKSTARAELVLNLLRQEPQGWRGMRKAMEAIRDLKFFCFDCQAAFGETEMPGDGSDPELHAICPKCGSEEVSEEAVEINNYALTFLPPPPRQ